MNEQQQLQQLFDRLPKDGDEAKGRFLKFKSVDPFPEVAPSLLNSGDIFDYVAATGMIYPFHPEMLGPATYEIDILNKCIYWDEQGVKHSTDLKRNDIFILKRNSIAFVSLEPEFRIPDYIALRFNLRISNIHRGILLGTGPIVDPGFEGNLLIPLHNLTTNDYELIGGTCLIKVEFTKLSQSTAVQKSADWIEPSGLFRQFPDEAKWGDPEKYLSKASPHSPIRSSIPYAIQEASDLAKEATKSAKDATESAKKLTFRATVGGAIALASLLVGLIALNTQVHNLVSDFYQRMNDYLEQSAKQHAEESAKKYIEQQQNQIKSLNKQFEEQKQQIDQLRQELEVIQNANIPKQPQKR